MTWRQRHTWPGLWLPGVSLRGGRPSPGCCGATERELPWVALSGDRGDAAVSWEGASFAARFGRRSDVPPHHLGLLSTDGVLARELENRSRILI